MATTDTQERHTASTPLSKSDYLERASKPQPGYTKTLDATDANIGHTVGREGGIATTQNEVPGQVYETWQLPDPQVALDAGLPAVVVPEHLIVEGDYAEGAHPQGAEMLDLFNREQRKHLGNPRLDEKGFVVADDVAGFEEPSEEDEGTEVDTTGSGQPVAEPSRKSRQRTEQGHTPVGDSGGGQTSP